MNSSTIFSSEPGFDLFLVSRTNFNRPYFNNSSGVYKFTSFGYIVSGSVEIKTRNRGVNLEAGTLFLIPQGFRYCSTWTGSPDIELFSVHTIAKKFLESEQKYQFQTIPEYSTKETEKLFREIYSLYESGTPSDKLHGLGLYFLFLSRVQKHLRPPKTVELNPAISDALDFIETNYNLNFSMNELARHCNISASRLFHLFAKYLGKTPVTFRNELRIQKATGLLKNTKMTIEEISGETGFSSAIYFREVFRQVTKMTPTEYRNLSFESGIKGIPASDITL